LNENVTRAPGGPHFALSFAITILLVPRRDDSEFDHSDNESTTLGACLTAAEARVPFTKLRKNEPYPRMQLSFSVFTLVSLLPAWQTLCWFAPIALGASTDYSGFDSSLVFRNEDLAEAGNTLVPPSPPSPECWRSAMSAFTLTDNTKALCQHLHEDHQKLLALMISKCHLEDLGKALMEDPMVLEDCLKRAASSREVLLACLKQLTDIGANVYTHYVAYVQQFCTRLTQELLVKYQVDAQAVLVRRYERLSNESLEQLESLGKWKSDFLEKLGLSLENELQKQLHGTLQDTLSDYFDILLKEQSGEHTKATEEFMKRMLAMQQDQELRHETWLAHQGSILQEHIEQLDRQHEKLQDQQALVDKLSDSVDGAVNSMLPLARLHGFLALVAGSYTWLSLVLQMMAGIVVVVVLTRPQRCRPFRHRLVGMLVLEVVTEALLCVAVQRALISDASRQGWIDVLQKCTFVAEVLVFFVGLLASFLPPAQQDRLNHNFLSTKLELDHLRQKHEQTLKDLEVARRHNAVSTGAASFSSGDGIQGPVTVLLPSTSAFRAKHEVWPPPGWYQHYDPSFSNHSVTNVTPATRSGAEAPTRLACLPPVYRPAQIQLPSSFDPGSEHRSPMLSYTSPHLSFHPNMPRNDRGVGPVSPLDNEYSHPVYPAVMKSPSLCQHEPHKPGMVEDVYHAVSNNKRPHETGENEGEATKLARTDSGEAGARVG
jgi:hypothetical protein